MASSTRVVQKLRETYPTRVPCLVRFQGNVIKLMVPGSTTGASFMLCIRAQLKRRKHMSLTAERAIFVFHNNKLLPGTTPLADLDTDKDKSLEFEVQLENVFG